MTSQEKKQMKQQCRTLNGEINQRLDQIAVLRSLAERTTTVVTGMPHGGGTMSREDIYIKLVDLSNEVNQKVDEYIGLKYAALLCEIICKGA